MLKWIWWYLGSNLCWAKDWRCRLETRLDNRGKKWQWWHHWPQNLDHHRNNLHLRLSLLWFCNFNFPEEKVQSETEKWHIYNTIHLWMQVILVTIDDLTFLKNVTTLTIWQTLISGAGMWETVLPNDVRKSNLCLSVLLQKVENSLSFTTKSIQEVWVIFVQD